jgi:hypothetical protein
MVRPPPANKAVGAAEGGGANARGALHSIVPIEVDLNSRVLFGYGPLAMVTVHVELYVPV